MLRAAKNTMVMSGYQCATLARRVAKRLRVTPREVTTALRQTACAATGKMFGEGDIVISIVRLKDADPRLSHSYRLVSFESLPELSVSVVQESCRKPASGLSLFFRSLLAADDKVSINKRLGESENGNGEQHQAVMELARKKKDQRQRLRRRKLPLLYRGAGRR